MGVLLEHEKQRKLKCDRCTGTTNEADYCMKIDGSRRYGVDLDS